jgi:hypothetical protein
MSFVIYKVRNLNDNDHNMFLTSLGDFLLRLMMGLRPCDFFGRSLRPAYIRLHITTSL